MDEVVHHASTASLLTPAEHQTTASIDSARALAGRSGQNSERVDVIYSPRTSRSLGVRCALESLGLSLLLPKQEHYQSHYRCATIDLVCRATGTDFLRPGTLRHILDSLRVRSARREDLASASAASMSGCQDLSSHRACRLGDSTVLFPHGG